MSVRRSDIVLWLKTYAEAIAENAEYLNQLDSAIGDGDYGASMSRGFKAATAKLADLVDDDIGALLKAVGLTLVSTVGGASGPLYGTFFLRLGAATAGKAELTASDLATGLRAGVDGVVARGKAQLGDKTMVDALLPAVEAVEVAVAAGHDLAAALHVAAAAAKAGAAATIPLVARKGRASYLGERGIGHQDPGATSAWLLWKSAADSLAAHS